MTRKQGIFFERRRVVDSRVDLTAERLCSVFIPVSEQYVYRAGGRDKKAQHRWYCRRHVQNSFYTITSTETAAHIPHPLSSSTDRLPFIFPIQTISLPAFRYPPHLPLETPAAVSHTPPGTSSGATSSPGLVSPGGGGGAVVVCRRYVCFCRRYVCFCRRRGERIVHSGTTNNRGRISTSPAVSPPPLHPPPPPGGVSCAALRAGEARNFGSWSRCVQFECPSTKHSTAAVSSFV